MARPGTARGPMAQFQKAIMGDIRESDPTITAAVDAIMPIVGDRGSVLLWQDIEFACGCARYSGSWNTIIRKLRKRLIEERMQATWPERCVGLRLLTHAETVAVIPRKRQKRMFRQAGKAIKELETADPSQLNMTERRLLLSQMDRLVAERKQLRSAQKELLEASCTIPRRTAPHQIGGVE